MMFLRLLPQLLSCVKVCTRARSILKIRGHTLTGNVTGNCSVNIITVLELLNGTSLDEEPVYTRANYQILQDLDLPFDEFAPLAAYSVHNMERILSGEPVALYAFLGLYADQHKGLNQYMEALLKDRRMIDEESVRNYIFSLIDKTIDEMKCGKLYLKACFKFIAPDLIMLMEHIGGLSPTGCLAADEFFTFNREGEFNGEYLIERNPHICRSEHVILNAVNNDLTNKYCRHLVNVCMVNGHSITPQRLNGCDFDGDLVLLPIIRS